MEKWKEILDYDILYEVSDLGRVRTRYNRHKGYTDSYYYLQPTDNGNGYLCFNWKLNGRQKTVYLHRLVAEAFVMNENGYREINHIDENKYNNSANNLEWCEHLYNCNYGTRNIRAGAKNSRKVECIETKEIFSNNVIKF